MKKHDASRLAALIANRWPARIQATVNAPAKRDDDEGYSVRVEIPRENRIIRLGREAQFPGVLDACAMLLLDPMARVPKERNDTMLDQSVETFNEEEAARYLGVKSVSIRAYASSGTLHPQQDGSFLLAELQNYKERRDARGRAKPMVPESTLPLSEAPSTHGVVVVEEADTPLAIGVPVPVLAPAPDDAHIPSEEERTLQAVIAHAFASIPGIRGLGRLSEIPRSWKVDLMTERGPESYRITRDVDGTLQQERW